jgi:hypothetical protein
MRGAQVRSEQSPPGRLQRAPRRRRRGQPERGRTRRSTRSQWTQTRATRRAHGLPDSSAASDECPCQGSRSLPFGSGRRQNDFRPCISQLRLLTHDMLPDPEPANACERFSEGAQVIVRRPRMPTTHGPYVPDSTSSHRRCGRSCWRRCGATRPWPAATCPPRPQSARRGASAAAAPGVSVGGWPASYSKQYTSRRVEPWNSRGEPSAGPTCAGRAARRTVYFAKAGNAARLAASAAGALAEFPALAGAGGTAAEASASAAPAPAAAPTPASAAAGDDAGAVDTTGWQGIVQKPR